MYRACMFCNGSLGLNEVVEHFPVGRRLAFDAARGRLWVVCRKCERWNLTPIEERWEAIETCERIFRGTRVRVSTDNVGLARHAEGLELVRIGEPLRPEFAAWRYGDQFGRRRTKMIAHGVGYAVVIGAAAVGGMAVGAGGIISMQLMGNALDVFHARQGMVKLRTDDGRAIVLKAPDLQQVRIRPGLRGELRLYLGKGRREQHFDGAEARRFAEVIVARINRGGGRRRTVQEAVEAIEGHGHPNAFLADVVRGRGFHGHERAAGNISNMPAPRRLALEMALHEAQERRAMEGELWLLERAWKEAEEIAGISDDLLLPEGTQKFLDENRPKSA